MNNIVNPSSDDLIQQSYIILLLNKEVIYRDFSGSIEEFCRFALRNHLLNYIRKFRSDALYYSSEITEDVVNLKKVNISDGRY